MNGEELNLIKADVANNDRRRLIGGLASVTIAIGGVIGLASLDKSSDRSVVSRVPAVEAPYLNGDVTTTVAPEVTTTTTVEESATTTTAPEESNGGILVINGPATVTVSTLTPTTTEAGQTSGPEYARSETVENPEECSVATYFYDENDVLVAAISATIPDCVPASMSHGSANVVATLPASK